MSAARSQSRRSLGILIVSLVLAACASTPQEPEPVAVAPQAEPPVQVTQPPAEEPAPQAQGRYTIRFDTMSVVLGEKEKAKVVGLAGQARAAHSVVVRGSCDRKAVGNAKEAAIARALAVRSVLVQEGVAADRIRVRYSTEDGTHAAVLRFN